MHLTNKIQNLTLEQKIGQLFFIGIPGSDFDQATQSLLHEISPGGVCLFARNIRTPEQTRKLLSDIRESLSIEPFLSLDQEGGLVDRLRRIMTPMPSAKKISQSGDIEIIKKFAEITAEVITQLGFNMNFAPVVDVIDEDREKYTNGLFSRAFGKSKTEVIEFTSAYLQALQENGCFGCLKHFPGKGAAQVDSHEEMPLVNLTQEEFFGTDIAVYREHFQRNQIHAVMVGHAAYPQLQWQEKDQNSNFLPSTLSKKIILDLLRETLGYQQIVITDDLEMGAILRNYSIGEAAKMALNAGNDFLLICANQDAIREAFQTIKAAVQTNEISESRIDESLERIARVKELLSLPPKFDENRLQKLSAEIQKLNDLS